MTGKKQQTILTISGYKTNETCTTQIATALTTKTLRIKNILIVIKTLRIKHILIVKDLTL
jgi:hypothetical protein